MKLTNVEIKGTDSPLLHINAEFVTIRDAYSVGRYFNELVRRNVDVEILPKSNNCCKSTTQPKIPVPEKIFRCGDATTVIWKDGTKTTVKLMKGADDSDYGAFTAALAKKIYGGNSKVMKYAGMVQRVKSKAEKKAEKKAKRKAESEETGVKKYIVSQYGQVAEYKGAESESFGTGQKVFVDAKTEDEARRKAVDAFRNNSSLTEFLVLSNGSVTDACPFTNTYFGYWEKSFAYANSCKIRVFAKDREEAKKVFSINPAPILSF